MFVIEFGINHLGNRSYLKNLLNFYLNSSFKMATLMLQSKEFYNKKSKYILSKNEYEKIIAACKKKKKKIGLSICDVATYETLKDLKFDFYKLLSVANIDKALIDLLKKKNKHIYISTGFSDEKRISKSLKYFSNYKKKTLLHTPMTYRSEELNFKKIFYLNKKFNIDIGYSNHNNNINTLYALSFYKPKIIFLYIKPVTNIRKKFPDNSHAFKINELENIKNNYNECINCHKIGKKTIKRIKIFK